MGAYHGIEDFKSLSHANGVFEQSRLTLAGVLRPAFGWLTDFAMRYLCGSIRDFGTASDVGIASG
jgi:coniferyl-aldehyde dehydrogenase